MTKFHRWLTTFLAGLALMTHANAADQFRVYFGTYTNGTSQGIYQATLDAKTGKLSEPTLAAEAVNPSFLTIHPSRKFLYAVGEIADFQGQKTGGVSAFAIDAATGKLTLLNQQSSQGTGPCHVTVDAGGKSLAVANYGGGSVASFPIGADGKLGAAASAIQHTGSSVNPQRQKEPHAHSINIDPGQKYAVAADLGLDQVLVYKLDAAKSTLTPNTPPAAKVAPGAGPRHFAFHPSGKFGYVINELGNTVTAFAWNAQTGVLSEFQSITTLPPDFTGTSYTAEVVAHPSGKFLYGSNRGHDSLAVYRIDAGTGRLTTVGVTSTGGKTPRNFNVDPTGKWLLAANQASNSVVVFAIDPNDGSLKPSGQSIEVGSPVCIKFAALE